MSTPSRNVSVEVVADPSVLDLDAIAEILGQEIDTIKAHEEAHMDATLEHRLQIGLQVVRAQHAFTAALPNGSGKNQHSEEVVSPGDTTSPAGFLGWLVKAAPDLKRATAYLYANAVRGLGLDHSATPDMVRDCLADRRRVARANELPAPTLKGLAKVAPKIAALPAPAAPFDPNTPEARAGEARVFLAEWIGQWDTAEKGGTIEDLDLPGLRALDDFLANLRDRIKKRIKTAA